MYVFRHENVTRNGLAMTDRAIIDVTSTRPFHVLPTNFSQRSINIRKCMLVARGAGVSGKLVDCDKLHSEEDSTNKFVHYKQAVSCEKQLATVRDVDVEQTDDWNMFDN